MVPVKSTLWRNFRSAGSGQESFLAISFVFFVAPLVQKASFVTLLDAGFISSCFLILIFTEWCLLLLLRMPEQYFRILPIVSSLFAAGMLVVNVFHLFFVVTNSPPWSYWAISTVAVLLFFATQLSASMNAFVVRLCITLVIVMVGTEYLVDYFQHQNGSLTSEIISGKKTAKRSVYVVSFDAMTSRQALASLYGMSEYPHVVYLEKEGFQVYDTVSPGSDTIDSFVEWLSQGTIHTSRTAKFLFNGSLSNPFYDFLRDRNFKIQFIYHSNYFGVDAGRIDSFFPKHDLISICEFIDRRYIFGVCGEWARDRFWKPILSAMGRPELWARNDPEGGFKFIAPRLAFSSAGDGRKWFSVSYVWFPGHSSHAYTASDRESREPFRLQMIERTPQLVPQFTLLKNEILQHDPSAVIVFVGDHGGWLTGNSSPGDVDVTGRAVTVEMIAMDRRAVLMAVFPREFCRDQIRQMQNASLLLKELAECASA